MKFLDTLKALSVQRQMMLAAAVIGVVLAMTFMVRGVFKQPMALLYSGLEPVRAGEIMGELDQRNVSYEIRQEAIFVPRNERDKIRYALAQEGLPRQAVKGYELLDDVNGFSVTSEMYNASYWRAKEGELTRTILAIPGVASARVHIGASLRSGFSRSQSTQTASVVLSTSRNLSAGQAEAIQYLIALAVSGLNPADVAVIDSKYGILAGPHTDKLMQPGIVAEDQAAALEAKIMRFLDARLGPGNAQVSVSVDVSRERERVSAVSFDPDSRVIRNRTTNDISEKSDKGSGALTVASNLPQAGSNGADNSSELKNSTESVAYELNEIRTETEKLPGRIKRISIAILLNEQALGIDMAAANAADMTREVAAEFEQLIAAGAGLDPKRGDGITVELMPFKDIDVVDMTPVPSAIEQLIEQHMWAGLQAFLLSLVVLALGLGVIRPVFTQKNKGRDANDGDQDNRVGNAAQRIDGADNPFDYLKNYSREREDDTAALLQEWLNDDRKAAVNE